MNVIETEVVMFLFIVCECILLYIHKENPAGAFLL
jgi:hypothetical protein